MNHGLDLGASQNVVTSGLTGNATEGNSDQLTVLVVRSLSLFLFLPLYVRGLFCLFVCFFQNLSLLSFVSRREGGGEILTSSRSPLLSR